MQQELLIPDHLITGSLKKTEADVLSKAFAIKIVDQKTFDEAGQFLKDIKSIRAEIDQTFDPSIKSAYNTHRTMCAAKREHTDELDKGERVVKPKYSHYLH